MSFKSVIVLACIAVVLLYSGLEDSFANSAEIKNVMKIQRMGGYIILVNYETHDTWTDNLLFKVYCKFSAEEFTFISASLNNVTQGWHKTEIAISDVIKKRYGSIREYRIELYCKGILVDTKSGY